jgi:anti-sigma regulatory factor (Ser/Thr protein kinase)
VVEGDQVGEVTGPRSSVSLDVPCRPEYLSLGRLVAGSLGVQQGWDEEAITDLKLVVTEISSFFLAPADVPRARSNEQDDPSPAAVLRLGFDVGPDEWMLMVSNPDLMLRLPENAFSDPHSERALGLTIVQALVDSVEQSDEQAEGTVFRVRKRLTLFENSKD